MFLAEECYVYPNEFIPERWYSRPELVKNKNAFAPFSLGKLILKTNHFCFADSFDSSRFSKFLYIFHFYDT